MKTILSVEGRRPASVTHGIGANLLHWFRTCLGTTSAATCNSFLASPEVVR